MEDRYIYEKRNKNDVMEEKNEVMEEREEKTFFYKNRFFDLFLFIIAGKSTRQSMHLKTI